MSNKGLLIGMSCPKCKSEGPFEIESTTNVQVRDSGTDDHDGFEWTPDSSCMCINCGHDSTVREFTETSREPLRIGDRVVYDPTTGTMFSYKGGTYYSFPISEDGEVVVAEDTMDVVDMGRITPNEAAHIRKLMHPLKFEYQESGVGDWLPERVDIEWNYDDIQDRLYIQRGNDDCHCIFIRTGTADYSILRASSLITFLGAEGDCYAVKTVDTLEEAISYILEG